MDFCTLTPCMKRSSSVTVFCEATGSGMRFSLKTSLTSRSAFSVLGKPIYGAHWYIASLISSGVAPTCKAAPTCGAKPSKVWLAVRTTSVISSCILASSDPCHATSPQMRRSRISAKSGSVASKGDRAFPKRSNCFFSAKAALLMFLPPFGTCCVGEEAAIAAPDNSKQNNAAKSPQEMFLFLCAGICDLPSCQCVESGPDTRGRKGKRCGHGVISLWVHHTLPNGEQKIRSSLILA